MDMTKDSQITTIATPNAAEPLGHYSQAMVHNGLVYVSGQLPIDPKDPGRQVTSIEEETEITLNNVRAVLQAAGSDLDKVLKVTIYISDISLWADMNAVYGRIFGDHRPARAAVPTKDLPRGFHVEIEAVAAVGS